MKIDIKYIVGFLGAIVLLLVGFVGIGSFKNPKVAVGSVVDGQGYFSTTTPTAVSGSQGVAGVFALASTTPLGTRSGIFGSVIITGTSTGAFAIYDATTTDITKRTNAISTSSITIASFPAGMPSGTYIFDSQYSLGLIAVYTATVGTTTITWK